MTLRRMVRGALRASCALPRVGAAWSVRIAPTQVPLETIGRGDSAKSLWISSLECAVNHHSTSWLLDAYQDALALKERAQVSFRPTDNGEVLVDAGDFQIIARQPNDIFILREILVDGVYDFSTSAPAVVWDIGMNVGIASLYFARRKHCDVFGYELSPSTFVFAEKNLILNTLGPNVVKAYNLGVGCKTETVEYLVDPERRGSTSKWHSPSTNGQNWISERGDITSCASAFEGIVAAAGECEIVVKIDCEGSEYEIIDALCAANLVRRISLLMVEWHQFVPDRRPQQLIEALRGSGFWTLSPGSLELPYGMLYAIRNR